MDRSTELKLLRRLAPPYFVWTADMPESDWPEWFEDKVSWGVIEFSDGKALIHNGEFRSEKANSGDVIYKDGDNAYAVALAALGEGGA